ncbi:SRC2-like protein [Cardamine amara subsp. amara]|uniref:SRC2-like protein n=1 Tax=Cardamine amara subsp. amara TaxID=228776 RepID=A0ABD0ZL52_CARAN
MECRSLDLTIISAEDLKDIQLIGKQDLYAVVSINGDARTKQKTKVDKDCGTKPKWKHQMKLTVDDAAARENRLTLVFEIVADRPIAGDKPVGEVSVPVKELLDQNKTDEEKTVTYAVRIPNGKPKGSLKFSFKFGEKYTYGSSSAPQAPVPAAMDHKTMDQPVTAYPPEHGAPSAYPAGPSGYPPPGHDDKRGGGAYGYPQPGGYPPQGVTAGYPPPGAYPQQGGYPGYPPPGAYPQQGGYPPQGYQGYPPQGPYGYPQQQAYGKPQKPQKPKKSGMGGMGLGLGLGAGLLGGLLVGEAVSDISDMGDMGGDFDF